MAPGVKQEEIDFHVNTLKKVADTNPRPCRRGAGAGAQKGRFPVLLNRK